MKNILYIVDDHIMVRNGLKAWLEEKTDWKVLKSFSDSKECLDFLSGVNQSDDSFPEIIIVDVQLINESGFSLVSKITRSFPQIKCVMYSMYDTAGFVLQAKDSGAKGYISKIASEEELAKCLEAVKNGGTYMEDRLLEGQNKLESIVSILTKQEKNIFEAILQGKTNDQISSEMFISIRTVEAYTSRLYDKIGVQSRADLIKKYK